MTNFKKNNKYLKTGAKKINKTYRYNITCFARKGKVKDLQFCAEKSTKLTVYIKAY